MNLEKALKEKKYTSKLDVIKKHSETLFSKGTFHHIYYTLHGTDHSKAIISKLDKLVDGINPGSELTKPEIFYLLASVYLHDVGMLISNTDDEDRANTISAQKKKPITKEDLIRDEHHLRSGKYIVEKEEVLDLDHVESECVKLICEGHRVVKLDTENYNDRLVGDERIRIRLLAALLRFSDELDISYERAPKELMKLLMDDMPDYSRLQWLKHYYTSGVGISPPQQLNGIRKIVIEIQTQYPDRDLGRKITEKLIFEPIKKSLSSVDRIFLEYGLNTKLDSPKIYFKEKLDKIPDHIFEKYFGQEFKLSTEIPQIKSFVGRNSELIELSSLLDRNIIIIEGIAGIGKTYIASKFAEEIKSKYDVHWFGDLSEVSTISSVLWKLAEFLKDSGKPRMFNSLENFGYDIDVLISILKDELITSKFAIFFDNYHKAKDELNPLMKQLLYINSSKIILITREELNFYNVVDEKENRIKTKKIDSWDYKDTQEMIKIRGIDLDENTELMRIHERLHGYPQYLNLFCILAQKSKPQTLLEKLPKAEEEAHSYLEHEVYNSLEVEEKNLIKIIAVYRIPETIEAFDIDNELKDIDETFNSLIYKFLVNEIGFGKYNIHEIIRDYCLRDVKKKKTLRNYHKSAAKYYLSKDKNPESLLEASYHYIEAGDNEKSAEIVINNTDDFIEKGFWKKIEEPLNDAIKTLSKYKHDRRWMEIIGVAHLSIGQFYVERGDIDLALKHAEDSSKALVRIRSNKIFDLHTLFGRIYSEMDEIDTAKEYYKKSLDFAQKKKDKSLEAVAYANIGNIYFSKGDTVKALELYNNSLNFFEKDNNDKNIAISYMNIASVYHDLNDNTKAYNLIKMAIKLFKEIGLTYSLAKAYETYASIYLDDPANEQNLNTVSQCLSKSLDIYKQIGHVRGETSVLWTIGYYYKKRKEYKNAIENYEKSIIIYEKLDEKSKLHNAYIHNGSCYEIIGNPLSAKEYFEMGKDILEKSMISNSSNENKLSLAEIYIILSEYDKAVEILRSIFGEKNEKHFLKCLAYVFMSISLFSKEREQDAFVYINDLIQYYSTNKYAKAGWDFLDITKVIEKLKPSQRTLIKDLISLIQNKTAFPIIRFDNINIERVETNNYAEVFHPFVGHKKITINDESLINVMKNLIEKGDVIINIDTPFIIGVERDDALMILGYLYKKGRINFTEIAPNNLKIGLTEEGKRIKVSS